jgi:cobalt/nickel transport system ATP-binding protein
MDKIIRLENIDYSYSKRHALSQVSLEIENGEGIALLGQNGSGKSTLLKILTGIVSPASGHYYFKDEEITSSKLKDNNFSKLFHSRIGFLMQSSDAQLFCTNVYEEISFAPRQMGLPDSEIERRVEDCLNMLGLGHLRHVEPYHLSEGEKRKVALASVLSMNPEVLALDEPMNGLDPKTKHFLKDLIISLIGSGKTVICSTHDLPYIEGIFRTCAVFSESHSIERTGGYEEIIGDTDFLKRMNII